MESIVIWILLMILLVPFSLLVVFLFFNVLYDEIAFNSLICYFCSVNGVNSVVMGVQPPKPGPTHRPSVFTPLTVHQNSHQHSSHR